MESSYFAFSILFLFTAVSAFGETQDDKAYLLSEGDKFYELGKFEEAISYFDQLLEKESDNVDALAKKGDALAKLEKYDEAESYYDRVFRIAPYHTDATGYLYLDKLLELNPNHVNALYKKGMSLAIFVDYQENSISYYDKALKIEPNRHDILTTKAVSLTNLGKFEEAISNFDRALKIVPNYVPALNGKGDALAKLEKYEEAYSYFDKALDIDSNNSATLYNKGDAFRAQQNWHDAFLYFYKSLEINPDNFGAQNKFELAGSKLNYTLLDGFIETTIHDSQGSLVAHLKINKARYLDTPLATNLIDQWNVTKVINRNGTDYKVHQYEKVSYPTRKDFDGGASDFGIVLPSNIEIIRADYWFYEVDNGDTVNSVITVFRPVS